MHIFILSAVLAAVAPAPDDIVIAVPGGAGVTYAREFEVARTPFAHRGDYLRARSRPGASELGSIRVAAPAGEFHVYLAWVRDPRGAQDVRARVRDVEVRLDQSRLANGADPEELPRNHMEEYEGACGSGLFRVTRSPIALREDDALDVFRSDSETDTITSLDYVVFSKHLYLDDLGNDSRIRGKPAINLRDYGPGQSGEIGLGLAFLAPGDGAGIEWTLPAEGLFRLLANPNRGPTRAPRMSLALDLGAGKKVDLALAGQSAAFGRAEWQDLGVIRAARGMKIRLGPAEGGFACCDLLRLTPVRPSELAAAAERRFETFTIQWEKPSAARPYLREVKVVPEFRDGAQVVPRAGDSVFANGVDVRVPFGRLPILGEAGDSGLIVPVDGRLLVELADDYGFALSTALLRREPFVWLKDLGIFACAGGDFASKKSEVDALATRVEAARREPFRSTSEKYYAWTGYDETRGGLDDRAFAFAYDPARPVGPRIAESIDAMPEVDPTYFRERIEDPKHRRMFLGWPDGCEEFYVLSNGAIGVTAASGAGTGHKPAEEFLVEFGAGDPPGFREHGDPSVTQRLEDGHHIIVHTEWSAAGARLRAIAFAYPLAGEAVETGAEPIAAFVRLRREGAAIPFVLRITPESWPGPANPIANLESARIDGKRIALGDRILLAFDGARVALLSAVKGEVLVRLDPEGDAADLIIPYRRVEESLIAGAASRGFDPTLARTKAYWDARLARGARIEIPDPIALDEWKTLLPRTLVAADLDVEGLFVLKTSPAIYEKVWLHVTAHGVEALARRGHFEEARAYLEPAFRWQGEVPREWAKTYTSWEGFFGVPPRYTALVWVNFHGWIQWAAARYFLFSDDRPWLDSHLAPLIASLEWTASQRRLTMREDPDGTRPIQYGWLPPGRVTDGSAGTSTFSDCINWMGFAELTAALERIRHPRAAEFRATADDYRRSVLRGLRLATRIREPVRLNDGAFVPYVPGYLESSVHEETMWYAAVVDGALEGILDSGILAADDPMAGWVLSNLEDNLFVIASNLADEAFFLGHGCEYVRRDLPARAVYTLASILASHLSRQTLTTFEHRSWGQGRVWDLAPWAFGYYTRILSGMLCSDEGDEIFYGKATPRAWLEPGKTIRVEGLRTRFGRVSFVFTATEDSVRGTIDLPDRHTPRAARLRIRVAGEVSDVRLNGRPAVIDPATGAISLPLDARRIEVEAKVIRARAAGS